jgi:translocation and assembly module TamB
MRLRKTILLLSTALLFLLAGLAGSWTWLVHSESGARWLFSQAQKHVPARLTATSVTGSLGSGLQLGQLNYEDDSTQVDAERISFAIEFDLLPPAINFESLQAKKIRVSTLTSAGNSSPEESGDLDLSLPLRVTFGDISISDVEYLPGPEETAIEVHSILASGSLHEHLVLDRLFVSIPDYQLALSGHLGLASPHLLAVELHITGELDLQGHMDGSLEHMDLVLDSSNPELQVSGTLRDLLQDPAWDLDIASSRLQWPLDAPEADVVIAGLQARSKGSLAGYNLDLGGEIELERLEASRLQLAGSGTQQGFTLRSLSLTGPELDLQASGSVDLQDQLQLALETRLNRLNPEKWISGWPQNHPVNGELDVQWDGGDLDISRFTLAVTGSPLSVQGGALIDLEAGIVDGQLSWTNLDWPVASESPAISSAAGQLQVSGQPDDWQLDGSFEIQASDFPAGQLQLSGSGNRQSLDATIHQGMVLGGMVSGDLAWSWEGSQAFNATLALANMDFTPLYPAHPAIISTQISTTGQLQPLEIAVVLQQLEGTVDGLPVLANGGINYSDNRIRADSIEVESGASTLSLDGSLYESEGLVFEANIVSLASFSNELSGAMTAAGTLSLNPGSPKFSAILSGQQLRLGDIEIERLETLESPGPDGSAASEFVFSGLQVGSRSIESLSVLLSGHQPLEHLALGAVVEDTTISLNLDGAIVDWADPFTSGWRGQLSAFELDHQEILNLALDSPTSIELNASGFSMDQACFSGSREARLCAESSWNGTEEVELSIEVNALPVALAELFASTDLRFSQVLNGTLNWSRSTGNRRKGNARFEISAGTISLLNDEEDRFETGPGLFAFNVEDGRLSQGDLDLTFPGNGAIDVDFAIQDLSLGTNSPIRGSTRIDLQDIGVAGSFFPMLDIIDGVLDVDLTLSGTMTDPAFNGKAELSQGRLENLGAGFSFVDINLSGSVSELDRSALKGSFKAGEGKGEFSANIDFEDMLSPVINLALKGDSLTLIDVPDLTVIANPDIELSWQNNTVKINGRLFIPTARLSPSFLPESSVRQSADVVITAGELPVTASDDRKKSEVNFLGNIEVALGEKVSVEMDFAELSVTGTTGFNWQEGIIPVGNGNFDLRGEILAYGQRLEITRGRIGFPGIKADNPHLNIRAERDIFGNVQIRKAGLMVAGTLRRPILEAYTVPMTNKDRAQTLLITGSDFDYEQGVGAVNVGMYILPRLFISYGIGVFEDGNVVSARYDIGRGFGIKATSGERDTGLDISYTVDR